MKKIYKVVKVNFKSGGSSTMLMQPKALQIERKNKLSSPYKSIKIIKTIPATKRAIKKWRGY